MIEDIRDFRNTYIAHQEKELMDREMVQAITLPKNWTVELGAC